MAEIDHGKAAWNVVSALGSALHSGEHSLGTVPNLLKRVLAEKLWQDFTPPGSGPVHHQRFIDFVTAQPTAGLGADVPLLERIIDGDSVARDLLDQAVQQKPGSGKNQHTKCLVDNIHEAERPTGTSESAALRRLRKDRPDLHAQVLKGEVSAHAASVEAGFRPKRFTVPNANKPDSIVATLRRQLDPEVLSIVTKLLAEGE